MIKNIELNWFKNHWKNRESLTLEDYTLSHLDFMISFHENIVNELKKVKKELEKKK